MPSTRPSTLADRVRDSSRRRRSAESTSVRDAIFAAAEGLLVEEGYEGLSLRRVAERIGYTPTTIYRHYKDKDHLVEGMVQLGFVQFDRALREAVSSELDLVERQKALWRAYVRFALDHPTRYRLMFMQRPDVSARVMGSPPAGPQTLDDVPTRPAAPLAGHTPVTPSGRPVPSWDCGDDNASIHSFLVLQDAVAELVAAGRTRLTDVAAISLALWTQVHGVAALALSMPFLSPELVDVMSETALTLSMEGLLRA
ncbi:MAG: TetR/AcrR family transcriptional regulator [Gemmatimonadaceae bacterium]|jgi:AcrR family transcriptional regulator|nr:TetR/AcrR family transcriptional regulator [Gemmatimonadaceae bacterium]